MLNCVMIDITLIHLANDRVALESYYEAMEVALRRQILIYGVDLGRDCFAFVSW